MVECVESNTERQALAPMPRFTLVTLPQPSSVGSVQCRRATGRIAGTYTRHRPLLSIEPHPLPMTGHSLQNSHLSHLNLCCLEKSFCLAIRRLQLRFFTPCPLVVRITPLVPESPQTPPLFLRDMHCGKYHPITCNQPSYSHRSSNSATANELKGRCVWSGSVGASDY